MSTAAYCLLSFAIGGVIGWLIGKLRSKPSVVADDRLENELRQQLQQRESDLTGLRNELTASKTSLATAQANQSSAERLLEETKALQAATLADMREVFRGLSAEALKQSAPEFLRLANETFGKFQETAKGDLTQRQESIKGLVEPLRQQLESYQRRLQQSETGQAEILGQVKKQLESLTQNSQSLSNETLQLRKVLSSNQARGRWGEETLRRVVEAAGMSAHCDFIEQAQSDDKKPDLIVKLPGDRFIIVDAKVPELDFLTAIDNADPIKRTEALTAHARKLKDAIKGLAERDYPAQFPNALDYVVLFLPAESLFSAALEGDRDVIIWAAQKRILLATPASLIALLRSVSVSWLQHDQTQNAREIAEAAREFYSRVAKFTEHFEKIRSGIERANSAYNDAVGSYERMVKPGGERLLKLGGGDSAKALPDVQPLDSTLRLPPAS